MRVFYWSGILVTATVLLNACTVGETPPAATNSPSPAATPVANASPSPAPKSTIFKPNPAVKVSPPPKQPLFKTAFVPSTTGGSALIDTTDRSQRLDQLSKKFNAPINNKRDPFIAIPGTFSTPVVPSQTKPQLPRPSSRVVVKPPVVAPPDPAEAKSINVTGVMDMAGTQYAIVNVPGEPTSRYVKVGQRLVNNQVLVKRIETAGTPTVVFQQFNVEVPRPVGQVVAAAPDAKNSGLTAPAPVTGNPPTTPTGVILPPAPNTTSPVLVPQNSVNVPVIVPPAGVPIPNNVTPATTPQ